MKKVRLIALLAAGCLSLSATWAGGSKEAGNAAKETAGARAKPARNVIILIPDGMSVAGTTLARLYTGSPLALDGLACGLVSTWSSDGTIADSAPAGSAFATGWKSQTGNIASSGKTYSLPGAGDPDPGVAGRPLATLMEGARLSGRATGIVSTSEFMHATPADFTSHDPSRKNYDNLTEQIVWNRLDVVLGGGTPYLSASARKDGEDMMAALKALGYSYVGNTAELKAFQGSKLFGTFGKTPAATAMSYDLDRDPSAEPSLQEMTAKAIEVLSKNPAGFCLMVEGSKVDWAAHANDPVGFVTDVVAFDKAVKAALDFASSRNDTIVLAVSDHGNSGISIGDRSISSGYDKTPWTTFVTPLKAASVTGEGLEAYLPAGSGAETIRQVVAEKLGIADLSDEEVAAIQKYSKGSLNYVVGPMVGARAKIGYTTGGHTGEDVVLYAFDPRGERPTGLVDNTEIGKYLAESMGVDLNAATNRLFTDAKVLAAQVGATLSQDDSDAENPVLVATKGSHTLRVARNKSVAALDGKEIQADGVAVMSGNTWYVSKNIFDAMK